MDVANAQMRKSETTGKKKMGCEGKRSDGLEGAGPATILLVEDAGFVRQVTCEVLRSAGYQVVATRNAKEAVSAFRRYGKEIRLLLTDVVLPGRNGQDLARGLRVEYPGLRTIFISGYPQEIRGRECGPKCSYLPKPFSAKSLREEVRRALGGEQTDSKVLSHAGDNW
jgi:CheY-like chemotaxis protein